VAAAQGRCKKTGEKAQFAGYDSERVIITASQPCKDKETGSIANRAGPGSVAVTGFARARGAEVLQSLSAKLGIDPTNSQDVSATAKALFSSTRASGPRSSQMQNVKGYPVKTSFTLALGGARCKTRIPNRRSRARTTTTQQPDALQARGRQARRFVPQEERRRGCTAAQAAPAVTPVLCRG